jgi:hypothetical protein
MNSACRMRRLQMRCRISRTSSRRRLGFRDPREFESQTE